jgi:hypothetical protein
MVHRLWLRLTWIGVDGEPGMRGSVLIFLCHPLVMRDLRQARDEPGKGVSGKSREWITRGTFWAARVPCCAKSRFVAVTAPCHLPAAAGDTAIAEVS